MEILGFSITSARRRRESELSGEIQELKAELDQVKSISLNDPILARIFAGTYGTGNNAIGELRDPLYQIPIVYACVRARAVNIGQVPFKLYRKGTEDAITSGGLVDLFNNPNPLHSRYSLWEGTVTSIDARGNAYLVPDPEEVGGIPLNMWLFNPDQIKPARARATDEWVGWWLKRKGQDDLFLEKEQVIHIKNYNLKDNLLGANPLEVAKATNLLEWDSVRYNYSFFKNDGTPQVAFVSETKLGARRKKELEKTLIEDVKGPDGAHHGVLLEGGLDVKQLGISQKDMEFLQGRKFSREEIMMIYKVPKAEVELYEDMNYATATSADRSFWKKTLIPLGRQIQEEVNRKFLYGFNVEGRFDFMAIDALNAELLEKAEAADKYVRMGYPLNVVNERLNLGFPEVDHGNEPTVFGPSLMLTLPDGETKAVELPMREVTAEIIDEDELAKGIRAKKWNELMQKLLPIMGRATSDVRRYFFNVTQKLYKILAKGAVSTVTKEFEEIPEDEILTAFDDEALKAALEKHILAALEAGVLSVAGSPVLLENPAAAQVLAEKLIKVLEINDTAKREVIEALRKTLLEGLAEGVGEAELESRIIDRMGQKMKDIQKRARTIARTEIGSAFSQGRWSSVEETGAKGIRWISSRDDRVRDTHQDLDGKTTPIGESFVTQKGNTIRFPHDPNAAAEEVINCRCTFEPIYDEE